MVITNKTKKALNKSYIRYEITCYVLFLQCKVFLPCVTCAGKILAKLVDQLVKVDLLGGGTKVVIAGTKENTKLLENK